MHHVCCWRTIFALTVVSGPSGFIPVSSIVSLPNVWDDPSNLPDTLTAAGMTREANVSLDPNGLPPWPLMKDMAPLTRLEGSTEGNMCMDGKLVPILFLLGPCKAGTSSMSWDLGQAGIANDDEPEKESHFFDDMIFRGTADSEIEDFVLEKREFMAQGPACPSERRVVGEFTPNNLNNFYLAPVLGRLYGEQFRRLKFIVILREPLDRLTSAYYFQAQQRGLPMNSAIMTMELQGALIRARLATHTRNPSWSIDQHLLKSMYGLMLTTWLETWQVPANQFYVVPMRAYFSGPVREVQGELLTSKQRVFSDLSDWLGVDLVTNNDPNPVHINSAAHPSRPPLPWLLRRQVNAFFRGDIDVLIEKLARGSEQGLKLGLYEGTYGTESTRDELRRWLENGW